MALGDFLKPKVEREQDEEEKQIINDTDRVWKYLKEARRRLEYEWFINDMYHNNDSYIAYNTASARIQNLNSAKAGDKVVINMAKKQVRAIQNFLNDDKPNTGVRASNETDNDFLRANREKYQLDYWYRHLNLLKENKLTSKDGVKHGIGWTKGLWDKDALAPTTPFTNDNGKETRYTYGQLMVRHVDIWEMYWDPMAQDMTSMRYICQAVVRTIAELKSNPAYKNTEKLVPDGKLSASILRQAQIRMNTANASSMVNDKPNNMDTVLVLEMFRRLYNKDNGDWEIWVTTRTESGILLRHEKWNLNRMPYEYFVSDDVAYLNESRGLIHDIREPIKALNGAVTSVNEAVRIMAKLNWLISRGANVNVIDDTHGQFIEYDPTPGGKPEQANPANLPVYVGQHIDRLIAFIEDVSGIHSPSNGKAPFAQASGDLVDTLVSGDVNNLTTLRANYDDYHVRLAKLMFAIAKENGSATSRFPTTEKDELGQIRYEELDPKDIDTDDDIEISSGSDLPYTSGQKEQMFMNMWKEKLVTDPKVMIRILDKPELNIALGDDEPHISRQVDEIKDVLDGKQIAAPVIFEDHSVHIATIDKFCNSPKWYDLDGEQQMQLQNHRQKHVTLSIQLAKLAASMQFEPIKRNMTVMERFNKMADTTAIERTQLLDYFGVNSDAAQIQFRGGLSIQDPASAQMQAQAEDNSMFDEISVQVSFADNHLVHMQTHDPVLQAMQANIAAQAKGVKMASTQEEAQESGLPLAVSQLSLELMQTHMKDHKVAFQATQVSPGLMPNDQALTPNMPSLKKGGVTNQQPAPSDSQQQPPQKQPRASKRGMVK